jgi:hypothetical protein
MIGLRDRGDSENPFVEGDRFSLATRRHRQLDMIETEDAPNACGGQ